MASQDFDPEVSDLGETAIRVPEVEFVSTTPKPEKFSLCKRFKIQKSMWSEHYSIFQAEYNLIAIFLTIPVITTVSGLIMYALEGHSLLSRAFLGLGPMFFFGVFIGFWKGIPEGPPYLAAEDGFPRSPPYMKQVSRRSRMGLSTSSIPKHHQL